MKTAIYNGKVYIERGHFEQAVLISDGIIEKVGTNEDILACASQDCEVIDADGKTILPGFNDSHLHLGSIGEWLTYANLSGATSIEDIVEIGKRFIEENPELVKQGLYGIGWNQDYFTDEKRILTRHDLDRISTDIPIVFERVCGHIVSANTKALEVGGITADTPQVDGGVFEIGDDGQPNGIFKENATYQITKVIPPHTFEKLEQLYIKAMEYAVSVGVTSVQSNDVRDHNYKEVFRLMHKLHDEGKLLVRYRHQFSFLDIENFKDFLATEFKDYRYDNKFLALGPLKLFKDGSLGARTALMRKGYLDDPGNYGVASLSDEQMDELCGLAVKNGIQVITHTIGDAAIDDTITNYERTMKEGKNSLRHGVVHCQITDLPILERVAKLDILVMVQPIFLNYDLHVVESRVGKDLASTSYAFHTLDKLGVHVAYGTDAPIEDCNPFFGVYSAVTRKDLNGFPERGFYPKECVDLEQAIDNYTIGSAYAEFLEDVKGRIKPGYWADLIILDRDIFTIPVDEIKDIKVDLTICNGKVVYRRV
ncbi:amidohydrolase [Lutispora thermophila]|uniref:Amidohydrolase 3 domain-containing protein n=1 Tax=Lutispora thermophila DSM 19022 TaxID=1122184 RepID=A0A1M6H804_9FIRM|nr:amidohydrolase [Lutispora thermophila]SHJ18294.1 hypothetical protein SAMN02745176_02678 [Lutispora thermophila DSM 19022]